MAPRKTLNSSTEPPSTAKKILFVLVVLIILPAIVAFTLAEAYTRITRPHIDLWEATGRKPGGLPVASWADIDAFSAYRARAGIYRGGNQKSVNTHGFISTPELAIPKPANTIRIAFLGGSSTAGTGPMSGATFADEETWPSQVVANLRKHLGATNVELINGALPGYTTFESYGRLWSRIRFFEPDAIVVYHGWNDMYYFHLGREALTWRTFSDGTWALQHPDVTIATHRSYAIDHVLRYSQVLTRLRLRVGAISRGELGRRRDLSETYNPAGLDVWRSNLRLIRETGESMGAKVFAVKQATLIAEDLEPEYRERVQYAYHGFGHESHVDAYRRMYQIIDEEFEPSRIIDATSLSGNPAYFYDQVHPTSEGAARIAQIVTDALSTTFLADQ